MDVDTCHLKYMHVDDILIINCSARGLTDLPQIQYNVSGKILMMIMSDYNILDYWIKYFSRDMVGLELQ